ncbi:hypothetical protein Plim_4267 (plasmid) [Planctopirus limnophila DSM 3776]|uniref:Uncharacterized protein n=1 Tax=Planctopirus limnophila (strain ATCC 43296 / DSM 3776 / IFAM 1008 / Mu 290) TaxID=521674 RepID=D5SZF4_PLAL2|nr:hypothetical protein [Planctopirus limnophila]ADG70074.1 hypothetical protein Plim_4267 [Planctopirus limnophila DSM 3776]
MNDHEFTIYIRNLEAQRNTAMNANAELSARLSSAVHRLQQLEAANADLTARLQACEPASESNEPVASTEEVPQP